MSGEERIELIMSSSQKSSQEISNDDERVCWACWESTNRNSDPLIRACLGCKDPSLQYIHQSCINKYITNLITLKHPKYVFEENVPFVSQETIDSILESVRDKSAGSELQEIRVANNEETCELLDCQSPATRSDESRLKRGEVELRGLDIRCTRCMDQYHVYARPVHPFWALLHDRLMFMLVSWLFISLTLLLTMTALVIHRANQLFAIVDESQRSLLLVNIFSMKIDVRLWAVFLFSILAAASGLTLYFVSRRFRNYRSVRVNGVIAPAQLDL